MPYGIVVIDCDGSVVDASTAARELLPGLASNTAQRCNDLFLCRSPGGPCEHECLALRAAGSNRSLPEIRIDAADDASHSAVWVTAAPLSEPPGAILHLRPGRAGDRRRRSEPHWNPGPELRIRAFGPTQIKSGQHSLSGEWLSERPGQILKYLLCVRKRVATTEEVAHAIWPESGPEALGNTRYVVHRLRDKLEPNRGAHAKSSFVHSKAGGYVLDRERIDIDVDEFERSIEAGSAAFDRLDAAGATRHLERAVDLYKGDFLADEPYADWADGERTRLRGCAEHALRILVVLAFGREDAESAVKHLHRLCELEPYDSGVHRELITTLMWLGRRSEAKRRYTAFSKRMRREFDEDPGFDLKSPVKDRSPGTPLSSDEIGTGSPRSQSSTWR
jgi:DNA-binding SARP family transcriptional activator